ncbi:hypothetical protein B0T14DRAFT_123462 [Immersiella caudata]|uniref:Secreted protein n=1 Tax=Immersiella caudata TaxID=314043 RepID=A0AA40C671_9PEZI|nr:hypothetical protein B0T14DRAFT_123462 [Immersiella caudata]
MKWFIRCANPKWSLWGEPRALFLSSVSLFAAAAPQLSFPAREAASVVSPSAASDVILELITKAQAGCPASFPRSRISDLEPCNSTTDHDLGT